MPNLPESPISRPRSKSSTTASIPWPNARTRSVSTGRFTRYGRAAAGASSCSPGSALPGLTCYAPAIGLTESAPAACALFWTLGAQQVGKAAITGWRDLLAPALRADVDLALWPFQGSLNELLARHRFVVAETYPAEFYRHLELKMAGGKGKQEVRQANAERLLAWAKGAGVDLEGCLIKQINDGFGADARGDDRFDAVVGLFGMLNVVLGQRASGEPDDPAVRRIEGWILGQEAAG